MQDSEILKRWDPTGQRNSKGKKYNTSLVPRLQHEVSVSLLPQSAVGL